MKSDIHPKYFEKSTVTCACGAVFHYGSTVESYTVDVCSQCHPAYTGKKILVDTAGRVDKFMARKQATEKMKAAEDARIQRRKSKQDESAEERITRKAKEHEEEKLHEKAVREEAKRRVAKKQAEKIVVKPAKKEVKKEAVKKEKKTAAKKTEKKPTKKK